MAKFDIIGKLEEDAIVMECQWKSQNPTRLRSHGIFDSVKMISDDTHIAHQLGFGTVDL
jgi:hypothetical protein